MKIISKKRTHLISTLSPETKEQFDNFCKDKQINKSKLVEYLLLQHIGQFSEGEVKNG